ncbi:uncharacterized protein F5891DRAFT_1045245 [Suillus fuscotomentosus]|uniref:DUF6533 domain-containing protein n=1 Tax=Suillus fuscotomentosus TaxID=1912939 RepID=A0AAD4E458_9AGAM|nr:uncharacterized protein F5891DRAFT_1045245 [Suillus fuscotomentosus]KAG1897963.1 hypothetical protein F5891DRAFT_1045245 [Suillus fuscotomentosus]
MFTTDLDAQQISLCTYAVLAGNSILIYDHVLTLPEEFAFIWRRPKGLAAMLFLLNRYLALLGIICSMVVELFLISDEESSFAVSKSLFSVIMAMRTYALYGRSQHLLTWMTIIIIALVGVACAVSFAQVSGDAAILPRIGCYEVYTAETVCKTRGLPRLSLTTTRDIMDVIFQDGEPFVASVLAMALIHIPNILTYYVSQQIIDRAAQRLQLESVEYGWILNFTSSISVTLISRLMLNLHKTTHTGSFSTNVLDDDYRLDVLTTRLDVQSAISSHYW